MNNLLLETDQKIVLIVHSVDTEGPLYESLDSTFERLEEVFGLVDLPKTRETLERLRLAELTLGDGLEHKVAEALNGHRMNVNGTWDQVDAMLDRCMAPEFRQKMSDSFGGGWVYNWHCLDLVGYDYNPRRRDLGYQNIFDHYSRRLAQNRDQGDAIHFHFHPVSAYAECHRCATAYLTTPYWWEVLCRRIVDRRWFPTVYRAGFQAERPDSHWLLEQYIPFDLTNMATDDSSELDRMIDFRNGRSGDWRRAPADWRIYHPDHDDYQRPGNCRRIIGRSLNIMSRIASIDQAEMDKAFDRANFGRATIVGICSHDYRDIGTEVDFVRGLIAESRAKYPDVEFKYCEAVEAFRLALGIKPEAIEPLKLELKLNRDPDGDVPNVVISTKRGEVFGPQPFLAIELHGRRFMHDNLDFSIDGGRWHYAFHADTVPLDDVKRIGVGAADKFGNFSVDIVDV